MIKFISNEYVVTLMKLKISAKILKSNVVWKTWIKFDRVIFKWCKNHLEKSVKYVRYLESSSKNDIYHLICSQWLFYNSVVVTRINAGTYGLALGDLGEENRQDLSYSAPGFKVTWSKLNFWPTLSSAITEKMPTSTDH